MLGIGFGEFTLILLVLIIVLGPERLPMFMKTVGKGIRSLRQASRDIRTAVGIDEMMRDDVTFQLPQRKPELPKGPMPVSRNGLDETSANSQLPSPVGSDDAMVDAPKAAAAATTPATSAPVTAPAEAGTASDIAGDPTGVKES